MLLTAEQIKAARGKDIKTEKVHVPEWALNGTPAAECFILIREFSGQARQKWDYARSLTRESKGWVPDSEALMATLACCDENLEPIFTEADIKWLTTMSHKPLGRIFEAAIVLNGLGVEAEAQTEKNGSPTSTGSGSTFPETSA